MPGILDQFFNDNSNDEKIDAFSPTNGGFKTTHLENLFNFEGEINNGNEHEKEEEEKNKSEETNPETPPQDPSIFFF